MEGRPSAHYQPKTAQELQSYLVQNPNKKFRIGAGLTGVSGGAIPNANETYIDMLGLNSLRWFDLDSGILIAEAGASMQSIKTFTEKENWCLPVMPGSLNHATIGGMAACHGGGVFSLKYGKIGNFILGMEIILPNGDLITAGGFATKISEGIQDKGIWIGSEGTFGFVTKIIIRCLPKLQPIAYHRIASDNLKPLLDLVPKLLKHDPYLIEFAEKEALVFSSKENEHVLWCAFTKEWSMNFPNEFRLSTCDEGGLSERFDIGHNLQGYKPFTDLDISFPVKYGAEAIVSLKYLLNSYQLEHIVFGHAGDGNYHIHVFYVELPENWGDIIIQFDQIVDKFQGYISGEHGIGKVHLTRFKNRLNPIKLNLFMAIKSSLDPKNQLPSLWE